MAIASKNELITIKIGEPENGRLPIEVWRMTGKTDDGGSTHQQITSLEVPLEVPTR